MPGYQITEVQEQAGQVRISARYLGPNRCPGCEGQRLQTRDHRVRYLRHESWGLRRVLLELETHKFGPGGLHRPGHVLSCSGPQALPNALIGADRFHVIRLVNHHFLGCWRDVDAAGSRNRGSLSLMPRHRHNLRMDQSEKLANYLSAHPALKLIYRFKQKRCYLLLKKHRNAQAIPRR